VDLEVRPQVLHAHPVDPRRPLGAADLAQRAPEVLRLQHAREEVLAFHRSVLSPRPSPEFIPVDRVAQGQRELPVGCTPAARHEATTPLLHAPRGGPVRAFGSGRCGAASLVPRLSALGCLPSLACCGPTLSSAGFCRPVKLGSPGFSPLLWTVDRSPRVRPRTFRA
jgi:hypothetical protein